MGSDRLLLFLNKFWNNSLFKIKTDSNTHNIYSYSSRTGKYVSSHKLDGIKFRHFNYKDFLLWSFILNNIKPSKNPIESGGLYMRYSDYSEFCSRVSYHRAKKKFIELELILPTVYSKYYVINPYYVCKINNLKIAK